MKNPKRINRSLGKNKQKESRTEHMLRRKLIERTSKRRLGLLIVILGSLAGLAIFRVGEYLWPYWLIEHRVKVIGVLIFCTIVVLLSSPLIIEYSKSPRRLSGSDVDAKNLLG